MKPEPPVLILEQEQGLWKTFLADYFTDTPHVKLKCVSNLGQVASVLDRDLPKIVFAEASFLNRSFMQKIHVRKNTDPAFRFFLIGEKSSPMKDVKPDYVFGALPAVQEFNKRFIETLPMPPLVHLLVVDDEEEIGSMVRDYFEGRKDPAFDIEFVPNGEKALQAIDKRKPDAVILDIKMPVMDGREFYAKLKERKLDIPVVVFFDSISGEELAEMRKYGHPAVVEKGYQGSSLSALMLLVKKLIYFHA